MRILDDNTDRTIKQVSVYLTLDEAKSLLSQLNDLIAKPKIHHIHVQDAGFEREVTIAIYSTSNLSNFDERSIKLIEKDE